MAGLFGRGWGRQPLVHPQALGVDEHEVSEGPAGVDAEEGAHRRHAPGKTARGMDGAGRVIGRVARKYIGFKDGLPCEGGSACQ